MGRSEGRSPTPERVENYRVASGETVFVRTLSKSYDGLMTHFLRPSQYHDPDGPCLWCRTKTDLVYKGYFPALVWDENRKLWLSAVFELTESAELDVRGIFDRGQEWKFSRLPDAKKKGSVKHFPIVGALQQPIDEAELPPAFDVLPVLRTLYHAPSLHLGVTNPMAERVFFEPVQASGPAALNPRSGSNGSRPVSREELREAMERQGWVPPEKRPESTNGKH